MELNETEINDLTKILNLQEVSKESLKQFRIKGLVEKTTLYLTDKGIQLLTTYNRKCFWNVSYKLKSDKPKKVKRNDKVRNFSVIEWGSGR